MNSRKDLRVLVDHGWLATAKKIYEDSGDDSGLAGVTRLLANL